MYDVAELGTVYVWMYICW